MKNLILSSLVLVFVLSSCAGLKNALPIPTDLESALALKDVLNSSTFKAIKTLNDMSKGKNTLPKEIEPVLAAMKTLGYGDKVDQVTKSIQKASVVAAAESEIIMKDAIKQIKFKDAAKIVVTGGNAATGVLKKAMYKTVTQRYSESIDKELGKTEVKKYWPLAAGAYNIFAKEKVDNNVSEFLAKRAVDALFLTVGAKEKETRIDYKKVGSKVVNKVFDYYKDKKINNQGKIVRDKNKKAAKKVKI